MRITGKYHLKKKTLENTLNGQIVKRSIVNGEFVFCFFRGGFAKECLCKLCRIFCILDSRDSRDILSILDAVAFLGVPSTFVTMVNFTGAK